jgi:hypothetical protein
VRFEVAMNASTGVDANISGQGLRTRKLCVLLYVDSDVVRRVDQRGCRKWRSRLGREVAIPSDDTAIKTFAGQFFQEGLILALQPIADEIVRDVERQTIACG